MRLTGRATRVASCGAGHSCSRLPGGATLANKQNLHLARRSLAAQRRHVTLFSPRRLASHRRMLAYLPRHRRSQPGVNILCFTAGCPLSLMAE